MINRKISVLVVDDSPKSLGKLAFYLQRKNFAVHMALNGPAAWQSMAQQRPDVIVVDLIMDGMSGYELCRQLRDEPAYQHIPIIFMTTLDETLYHLPSWGSGIIDYLAKPISVKKLADRIKSHARQTFTFSDACWCSG